MIWEEKRNMEPMKNELKQNEGGEGNITTETKNAFVKNTCGNTTNEKKWKRNCPKCGNDVFHTTESMRNWFNKLNTPCRSCYRLSLIKPKPKNEWERKCPDCGISIFHKRKYVRDKFNKQKRFCKKCRQKGSRSVKFGKKQNEEVKEKLRKTRLGRKMHPHTKIALYISNKGKPLTDKRKQNISNAQLNHPNKKEINRKKRLATIKRLQNQYGILFPNFNKKACEYFQWLNMWNGWNGQYAVNGGEYFIKDLGYWVDYYEPKENVVIEWDESTHYNVDNQLKKRDNDRMIEIKAHLKCRFMRFNEKLSRIKEY